MRNPDLGRYVAGVRVISAVARAIRPTAVHVHIVKIAGKPLVISRVAELTVSLEVLDGQIADHDRPFDPRRTIPVGQIGSQSGRIAERGRR